MKTIIQSRSLKMPCRKFSGSTETAHGEKKLEIPWSSHIRDVNLNNKGTKINNHSAEARYFFFLATGFHLTSAKSYFYNPLSKG